MNNFDLGNEKVLVTGGAGFIGSHLVDRLVEENADVTVLDNLSTGRKENLTQSWQEIEFVNGDVRNDKLVEDVVESKDLIFHLAANASVPKSVENPRMDYETNSTGTFNLLKACRGIGNNVKNIVYASTAAVYGEPSYTPIDEDHPTDPISPYGASKLSAEKIGMAFNETYELPFTSLRIFNVYGPRQKKYVMFDFIEKLEEDRNNLEVLGTGEQERSFCYVNDAITAILLASDERDASVYNLAGDSLVKIKDLAEIITSKIAPEAQINTTGESWEGDIQELVPDNSKIKQELNFAEETSLEEGIDELIDWYERESSQN